MRNGRDFRSLVDVCQEAVSGYLQRLWNQHGGFGQLEWEKQADEPELQLKIVRLANLGVRLRAIRWTPSFHLTD